MDKINDNEIKKVLREYDIFYISTAAAIFLKILVYGASARLNFNTFFEKATLNILLSAIATGLVLPGLLLASSRRRPVCLLVMNIVISALLIADTWYGRYYYTPLNINTMLSANMDMIGTTTGSIGALFKFSDIFYVIDFPFYIYLMLKKSKNRQIGDLKYRTRAVISVIVLSTMLMNLVYFNTDREYMSQDNNYYTKNMGVVNFHLYDLGRHIKDFFSKPVFTDEIGEEIKNYFDEKNSQKLPKEALKYHGAEKGKNIIIIQMEALQNFVIGLKINGQEVTPNLNRLLEDSIYFNNIYVQTAAGNTSDAEFLANVSMYPAREGSVYARFNKNRFYSLPLLLKELGYESNSFHANNEKFWSRGLMYKNLGFKKYYSVDDYQLDELYGFDGTMLSDKSFYRQTLAHMEKNIKAPYYSFIISLSSHHPFTFFADTNDFNADIYENTNLGNYLKAQHYSDYALGTFIDALKEKGLYDDTLIVVYGDHSGVVKADQEKLMGLLGKDNSETSWISEQKVPVIIKGTNIDKGQVISTLGGQVDILPTLLNLLGIESKYAMGRDLFNTDENFAVFRDGSFIKDNIYYSQNLEQVYEMNTGEILNKKDFEDLIRQMRQHLKINDMILTYDAFRHMD